jgi:hypothetical protein
VTATARRRWSKELESEIDGIAMGRTGPVLLHGYDPPAGGKWVDSVIPGKLAALDRHSGELLWVGPCEVGYGRGFGAAIGKDDDIWVLGPGTVEHRVVRMSLASGELRDVAEIPAFDEAHVDSELGLCIAPSRVFGVGFEALSEAWAYSRNGERYHLVDRSGAWAFVVYTDLKRKLQGVLRLDARTGEPSDPFVPAQLPGIRQIACIDEAVVLLGSGIGKMLPPDLRAGFQAEVMLHGGGEMDTLSLVALRPDARPGEVPLWHRILSTQPVDDQPEVSICADSGKVYLMRGAMLEALDGLSGRPLGNWTVPGLDLQIGWQVVDGGGLLAEETRASLFELPA